MDRANHTFLPGYQLGLSFENRQNITARPTRFAAGFAADGNRLLKNPERPRRSGEQWPKVTKTKTTTASQMG
jgi:hypothetical protein